MAIGNHGEYKVLNDGINELKFKFGSGYRIYFSDIDGFLEALRNVVDVHGGMTKLSESASKGRKEGLLAGKIEIARKLLQEKTDPAFVAKITELSIEIIKELQKKHN